MREATARISSWSSARGSRRKKKKKGLLYHHRREFRKAAAERTEKEGGGGKKKKNHGGKNKRKNDQAGEGAEMLTSDLGDEKGKRGKGRHALYFILRLVKRGADFNDQGENIVGLIPRGEKKKIPVGRAAAGAKKLESPPPWEGAVSNEKRQSSPSKRRKRKRGASSSSPWRKKARSAPMCATGCRSTRTKKVLLPLGARSPGEGKGGKE